MKIWVDDIRTPPSGDWVWAKSVGEARIYILGQAELHGYSLKTIKVIDLDHDAGEYNEYGGDYINILNWMESMEFNDVPPIHIHSMNPVGISNMRLIIQHNGWREI